MTIAEPDPIAYDLLAQLRRIEAAVQDARRAMEGTRGQRTSVQLEDALNLARDASFIARIQFNQNRTHWEGRD